ncbi:MAG: hypothetical protein Q9217_002113 [Psora testacea]
MFSSVFPFLACAATVLSVPHGQRDGVIDSPSSHHVSPHEDMASNKRAPPTLADCLSAGNVPVRFASSNDFSTLAQPYNLRLAYRPAVIVLPTTTEHVSNAVVCAGKNNVKLQAKSGGHSYASFSSGGQDGSMIIDLESFQHVSVDVTGVATVGTGVRLGNIALGIYNEAKRALPHGTCPGVGIGGHATHGGFGYSSRAWGLTLDTIVAMDTVLANGTLVHVSENEYPDLWYALRGDASDFGIVTTFYLQTQPAPDAVVNWQYSLPDMFHDALASAVVFQHIQEFALNASLVDRKLGLGVYLDGNTFSVSGTYFGDLDTFNSKLAPELLRGLPTPSSTKVQSLSWLDSLVALANNQPLQQPTTGYNAHDNFFAKSVVTPSSNPLTADALNNYFQYIIQNGVNNASNGPWFSIVNLYGGPDSQINAVPSSSAAYSDRSALWVVQHYGYTGSTNTPFPVASIDFIDGLNEALTELMIREGVAFGAYQNYVDPSLSAQQAHELYYGRETYERLLAIKNAVDSQRVFWNPQSVGN